MTYQRQSRRPGEVDGSSIHQGSGDSSECSHVSRQLRRRRAAAQRLPVLTSGHADPWQPARAAPSEVQIHAAAAALVLLDSHGTPGLLDRATCRAMHRGGYQRLAVDCWRRSSGEAA